MRPSPQPSPPYSAEMAHAPDTDDPPPIPPVAPTSADCCRGGCDLCVFEIYEEELARYEAALLRWKLRHP